MPTIRESLSTPRIDPPRRARVRDREWEAPILDREHRLVGWTRQGPKFDGGRFHHAYAERLVGGPVAFAYIQLDDPVDAQRAGAPPDWNEPWRCLALFAEHAARSGNGNAHGG